MNFKRFTFEKFLKYDFFRKFVLSFVSVSDNFLPEQKTASKYKNKPCK